jgi:hypothetical protein
VLMGITTFDWLSIGAGPALGFAEQACPLNLNFSFQFDWGYPQKPAPPPCPSYSSNYAAAELRIEFLPGVGRPEGSASRARTAFKLALVATMGATLGAVPAGESPAGFGLNLVLGFLRY